MEQSSRGSRQEWERTRSPRKDASRIGEARKLQERSLVAILNVGGRHDGVQHETLGVDQDMPLLALDLLAGVVTVRIDRSPALFRALHALGVDDGRGRAGLPPSLFATLHIERVMQPLQRAVVGPSDEVLVDRAPGRQVLRDGALLTPGAEDVHHPVRHLADMDRALVASGLGRRNHWPDLAPLRLGRIALVYSTLA